MPTASACRRTIGARPNGISSRRRAATAMRCSRSRCSLSMAALDRAIATRVRDGSRLLPSSVIHSPPTIWLCSMSKGRCSRRTLAAPPSSCASRRRAAVPTRNMRSAPFTKPAAACRRTRGKRRNGGRKRRWPTIPMRKWNMPSRSITAPASTAMRLPLPPCFAKRRCAAARSPRIAWHASWRPAAARRATSPKPPSGVWFRAPAARPISNLMMSSTSSIRRLAPPEKKRRSPGSMRSKRCEKRRPPRSRRSRRKRRSDSLTLAQALSLKLAGSMQRAIRAGRLLAAQPTSATPAGVWGQSRENPGKRYFPVRFRHVSAKAFDVLFGQTHRRGSMLRSGRMAAAAASLLLAGAFFVDTQTARAATTTAGCQDADVAVLAAPIAPWKGAPLRVLVAAEQAFDGEFALIAPDGSVAAKSHERSGGPPYFWIAEVATPAVGTWHATLVREAAPAACRTITRDIVVSAQKIPGPRATPGSVWPIRNTWNRATENLFSAWIEKLFDAPLDTEPSWKAWHEVLRDQSRNLLFNYLGANEDNVTINLRPDCADFAYFLRAYFAFKMGLPFGYSNCSRGGKCYQWFNMEHPEATRPPPPPDQRIASALADPSETAASANAAPPKQAASTLSFAEYLRIVGDVVHSGSVRVSGNDDNTDFYTVPLTQESLRPGTVYADPYGHVMMLARRVPQSASAAGVLLAVDA